MCSDYYANNFPEAKAVRLHYEYTQQLLNNLQEKVTDSTTDSSSPAVTFQNNNNNHNSNDLLILESELGKLRERAKVSLLSECDIVKKAQSYHEELRRKHK